jgi:hypothetical protein
VNFIYSPTNNGICIGEFLESRLEQEYNVINNNCQHFVLAFVTFVSVGQVEWPSELQNLAQQVTETLIRLNFVGRVGRLLKN